ncbi:MAG: BRO family protein [Eubacteriales bacterium]
MKKELMSFTHREVLGKIFTIYGDFENPMFLAKDVAEWIDYSYKDSRKIHRDVSKMLQSVDEDEKVKCTLNLGGEDCLHGGVRANTEMWFLTEDGLYEVLMQSRKPIAKAFKKEVKQILKAIRKQGAFFTSPTLGELLNDPDRLIEMLQALKEEKRTSL